jgi:hypothetical protein
MADKIKLVQGDTRPNLVVILTDDVTGLPIDVTGATVRLKFRAAGAEELTETLVGAVINGTLGECMFAWTPTALAGEPGDYEGEIEITFADGKVQTVYDLLKFKVRAEF